MLGGTAALAAIWLVLGWSTLFNSQYAALDAPDQPTLRAMHQGIVEVDWHEVAGADRYELQLQRPSGWVTLPDEQSGDLAMLDDSSAMISNLSSDTPLDVVRVRAGSCRGWSAWSEPAEQLSTHDQDWSGVAVPRFDPPPIGEIGPETIWSASIEVGVGRQDAGFAGYSIREGLGAISASGFRDGHRQFSVPSVLRSKQGFALELFGPEPLPGDFIVSLEDEEAAAVTVLSTCDALRHESADGVRFVWPRADLDWSVGQRVTISITRGSELPPMRVKRSVRPLPTLTAAFEAVPPEHVGEEFSLALRFSAPVEIDADSLVNRMLRVTGGYPVSAQPVNGESDRWELQIAPDGRASVHVSLAAALDCGTESSICTQHLVPLSNRPAVTVPGPAVTAEFLDAPEHHSGLDRVAFRISLSEPIALSALSFGHRAIRVRNGSLERVRRADDRGELWDVIVIPESSDDIVVTLDPGGGCSDDRPECLELRRISGSPSLTIPPATVHLTFDDGPSPEYTPLVLDILKRHDARATFFVVGRSAVAFPEVIERMVSEGHTLANHTWAHDDLLRLSEEEVLATLLRTQRALGEHATPCFRPPSYRFDQETVRQAASIGLRMVLNTGVTADWRRPGADVIAANIISSARPNVILVLHDGGGDRGQTIEALDTALTYLRAQRFAFEPVCE